MTPENIEEYGTIYDGDANFADEPRWAELNEQERETYARLLTGAAGPSTGPDSVSQDDKSTPDAPGTSGAAPSGPSTDPDNHEDGDSGTEQQDVDRASAVANTPGKGGGEPPNSIILEADEDLHFEADRIENQIVVTKDVWRKVYPHRSLRPTYILLYRAGAHLPESMVQNLRTTD